MAKKKAAKVNATQEPKLTEPVRLDLLPADKQRLAALARKRGLSMAAFVRMLVLEKLDEMEAPR